MEEEVIVPVSGETEEEEVKKPREVLKILVGIFCLLFVILMGLLVYQLRFVKREKPEEIPEPTPTIEASPSATLEPLTLTEKLEKTEKEIKELDFDEEKLDFPPLDMEIKF